MYPDDSSSPEINEVITDSLRFKMMLQIGDEAYLMLKVKKHFNEAIGAYDGAMTGVNVAKNAALAASVITPSGFWAALGFGTLITPIGLAVAAGITGAGLTIILNKSNEEKSRERVVVIPKFINTPLDILATTLFDFIATLGMKIALIDDQLSSEELNKIEDYFVKEWGYNVDFVRTSLIKITKEAKNHSLKEITEKLAEYKLNNPDCNFTLMSQETISFLKALSMSDGVLDEREEIAIEKIEALFKKAGKLSVSRFGRNTKDVIESLISNRKNVKA